MKYNKKIIVKNGTEVTLRNGEPTDGKALLEIFRLTHEETDYLLSYPEESFATEEKESLYLARKADSPREVELFASVNGRIVGIAGVDAVGEKAKVRHRAEFGISVIREYWGLGIGRALAEACIECARSAGFLQLELIVVADNARALALYRSLGYVEYGRNPKGFRSRTSGFQEVVLMRLEL